MPRNIASKFEASPSGKLSLRLWLRLLGCTSNIEKRLRQKLMSEFSMTLPQFDVLAALERVPGGLTMSNLSQCLLVSNGNVTVIVARLMKEGLVVRMRDKADRRSFTVKLTAVGASLFKRVAKQHERWVESIVGGLPGSEIKTLMAGLGKLKTWIEGHGQ